MKLIELFQESSHSLQHADLHFGHGVFSAQEEALWLIAWQLGLSFDIFDAFNDESNIETSQITQQEVSDENIQSVRQWIQKRIETQKPVAYLTQEAWLQGVSFYVDERVIIPRSFIAELIVDESIDSLLQKREQQKILDLCTGNGSLAILCAMFWFDAHIVASDISSDALAVAQINVNRHDLANRIQLLQSNNLEKIQGVFDLIVCNPPYVNAKSMSKLPAEYQHEPALALAGGADGMDFVRELLPKAAFHLAENGILILEIGNEYENFQTAFPEFPMVFLETSAGFEQVLLIERADLIRYFENHQK